MQCENGAKLSWVQHKDEHTDESGESDEKERERRAAE